MVDYINLWMITSNWYCNSIYKIDCIFYATFLAKTIWLPRLLSQYTKLHTVTPPYPYYATYVPNRSPQISNQLLTTLTKLKVNP